MAKTVIVRVDEDFKKKLKRYKVNISGVVRSALAQELRRQERRELVSAMARAKRSLSKVPDTEIVRGIRETRDSR